MMNAEPSVVNMGQCTHPEILAGTEWKVHPLDDSNACFIEPDEDDHRGISSTMKFDRHSPVLETPESTHPERMWTLTALEGFTS